MAANIAITLIDLVPALLVAAPAASSHPRDAHA